MLQSCIMGIVGSSNSGVKIRILACAAPFGLKNDLKNNEVDEVKH